MAGSLLVGTSAVVVAASAPPAYAVSAQAATIAAGTSHACEILSGKAYCWGSNANGQLGDNSTISSTTPVAVYTGGALAGIALTQISAGTGFTCALASSGAAYCWGSNANGQLGNNSTVQSNVPVAVNTAGVLSGKTLTQIGAGQNSTCVLSSTGAAYCWGANGSGQLGTGTSTQSLVPVPVVTSGVLAGVTLTQITVGPVYACALASTAAAYCWGADGNGQLGNGSAGVTYNPLPVAVTTSVTFIQITAGSGFTCALSTSGAAYCWGANGNGQLGNGSTSQSAVPVAVSTSGVLAGVALTQITEGNNFTCALAGTGTAYCWGAGPSGQLGNNSTSGSSVPVAVYTGGVLAGKTLTQISAGAGANDACAVVSAGAAYCWGTNASGQLGNPATSVNFKVPVPVMAPVGTVSAGMAHACSVSSGAALCWGDNSFGELGNNSTAQSNIAVAVTSSGVLSGKTVTQVATGNGTTCALDSTGTAYCWGNNASGELGNGSTTNSSVPVAVTTSGVLSGKTLIQIAVGNAFTCALDNTGTAYCWGNDIDGQLGIGSTSQSTVPVAVSTSGVLSGVTLTQITAGGSSACALSSTGAAYCWGGNGSGQLGNGSVTQTGVAVAVTTSGVLSGKTLTGVTAGLNFTCALDSTGASYCWGHNGEGELGNNSTSDSHVPVLVTTSGVLAGRTLIQVAAGGSSVCALDSTGAAFCWGSDSTGQLGNGSTTQSTVPVAVTTSGVLSGAALVQVTAGGTAGCALGSTGAAYCWGGGSSGQLGNGSISNSSVPVTVTATGLTIAVSASPSSSVLPGSAVHYTVTVTNIGQSAYAGAAFTDSLAGVLDDASFDNDASATIGSASYTSPNLTWTGSLAIGATATITFSVTVNNPDTGNRILSSVVTSASLGNNCAASGSDPRCSSTVTVLVPGLTITLTPATSSTTPGSVVGYTVTVTDTGQTAYSSASFTDSLTGVLDDASYNGDAVASSGSVSFTSPNLTWSGSLAVGATATITFSVTVHNPDTGDKVLNSTVVSATAGSNCPSGGYDPRCASSIPVLVPGLSIAASTDVATTVPGGVVHYTVTVTNSGQTAYAGATFTVPLGGVLDDAVYNGNAAASAGSVSFASPALTWTGSLAVGASATVTFSVTVNNPDTGDHVLAATVASATPGSSCPPGGGGPAGCTVSVPVAQLTIVNSSDVSSTTPGSVVRFTATFTNAGQVPYTGITITTNAADVFDDAVPDGDQTATSGVLSVTGTGVSWTGSIGVGGSVTVTGTVTVSSPDTGNKLLASTITTTAAGSNCPPSGGSDPACSVAVPVLVPGLTVSQAANTTTAVPGQVIGYTVTITDTGQTPYAGAVVTESLAEMLDDASYDGDAAAATGTVAYAAPVITWTGSLAPGATAVVTFSVTVNNPDAGDKLVITAVSSAATGSSCPPGTTAAPCQITVPVLTPALTIVKTASTTTPVPGQRVTYTITVTDSGQTPYAGASFTDDLTGVTDDAAYDADASATAGTVTWTAPVLAWTGNLTAGASAVITYSVTVSNPDNGDLTLANTVTSPTPGSNCPAGGTDPRCTVTLTIVNAATLTITNTAAAPSAAPGAVVHYTITIANSGLTSYAGATLTDDLTGILDDAAYNGDASAAGAGTLAYTAPDLTWTGTVPAAGSITITFTATINSPDTGNMILTAAITSASAGSNCPRTGGTDPRCTATVTVSQLAITAAWTAPTTTPGSVLGFTASYANTGQTPYYGITITTDLTTVFANAVSNGDQSATAGTLSVGATSATWTGDIPVGQSVTITGTITIDNPDTGSKTLQPVISTTAAGSNCPPASADPRCAPAATVQVPALTISQAASTTAAVPGQVIAITLTITNTGQTPYTAAAVTDNLAASLDDAAYNGDAAATAPGTLAYTAGILTWTGDLAADATVVITFTVTVDNPDTGDKLIITDASSPATGSTCPPGTTTAPCRITVPVLTPALTITKTASTATATPGQHVTYTITITDTGQTPYTAAAVTDDLTGVLDDAAYTGDATTTTTGTAGAGTLSYTAPDLTWTGTLNPADTATITYSVTVLNPDTGSRTLVNTVTTTAAGANCPAGSADPRCTATVTITAGVLTITAPATASLGTSLPGTTLTASLGTTQVTDDRGFGASWTVTVAATPFTTGAGLAAEIIPPANVTYNITALSQTTGTATFTTAPATTLSTTPANIVTATSVGGNTTATWNPQIQITIPPAAIAGQYTATITQSVS